MFSKEVASPVFTGQIISGKASSYGGNEPIKVILVDGNTQETITTGQVASAKVKIVLLPGDYCGSTTREFKSKIVTHWIKKKNILQGSLCIDLKRGCVTIGEIKFKNDRNAIKNVKFRLGAMVVNCPYEVQEAITRPFDVKDHRNLPKTLRRLSLEDNVGRLKNISKKSSSKIQMRLKNKGIVTVAQLLKMHSSNPCELQEICGIKGKRWEELVNHAKTSLKENMCIESISQQSNIAASVEYDHDSIEFNNHDHDSIETFDNHDHDIIEFDDNCYKPHPCEEQFGTSMEIDQSFSIDDIEISSFDLFKPCLASQEGAMIGAWAMVGNRVQEKVVKAKKRWMKLRVLSIVIFKKVRVCGMWV
ncbi:calmodulin-binding protein 60 D-like [Bidens hawaiensis]|uniref:calmodulin-binding protein 60 D-like n=1 Tax=Bidens hawaiensis TaxID=980011 RepID=UPI004049E18A